MADATLLLFVKEALSSGSSRIDTENALIEAGWPKQQIANALEAFSTVDFPIPVPIPKAHLSARDTFLYLVMFSMLYLSAYNLGSLLVQFVNLAFPDPAFPQGRQISSAGIRFSISALVVAFPVFLVISSVIAKQIHEEPAQRLSAVRKWLTHLTLAIASCIIVGDLIYLINNLLSGGLTMRFILKVLIVGIISCATFYYYFSETRRDGKVFTR